MGVEIDVNAGGSSGHPAETSSASVPVVVQNPAQVSTVQAGPNTPVVVASPPAQVVRTSNAPVEGRSDPVAQSSTAVVVQAQPAQVPTSTTGATVGTVTTANGTKPVVTVKSQQRRFRRRDYVFISHSSTLRQKSILLRRRSIKYRSKGLKLKDKARYYPQKAAQYDREAQYYLNQSDVLQRESDGMMVESDRVRPYEHSFIFDFLEGREKEERIKKNKVRAKLGWHIYGPY